MPQRRRAQRAQDAPGYGAGAGAGGGSFGWGGGGGRGRGRFGWAGTGSRRVVMSQRAKMITDFALFRIRRGRRCGLDFAFAEFETDFTLLFQDQVSRKRIALSRNELLQEI